MTPLALYIHIPWCVRKCPYCDFNSHAVKHELPEQAYIDALLQDLTADLQKFNVNEISSIFIGGGTPSLFAPQHIKNLLVQINQRIKFTADIEITLEANPGTVEHNRFEGFVAAGINRLSIGVQSFQAEKLQTLGRIHNHAEAINAVVAAKKAGFNNINIDLMYGLPKQTTADALADLTTAVALNPTHLSWYQLTLEPNTLFYQRPPVLPHDDDISQIQERGQQYLAEQGFQQYEISAYSKENFQCQHNLNYWQFGDYLAIGAGAHGKITHPQTGKIHRYWKTKHPKAYLNPAIAFIAGEHIISEAEKPVEFMLNALRLYQPIAVKLFEQRTHLPISIIEKQLVQAKQAGLITYDANYIAVTQFGHQYLNDLLELFLPATAPTAASTLSNTSIQTQTS